MSADNGVYILETSKDSGKEYRVAHLQAVENVYWDYSSRQSSNSPDVCIQNARRMWKDAPVFVDRIEALRKADEIASEILSDGFCPILEYGISFIVVDREF